MGISHWNGNSPVRKRGFKRLSSLFAVILAVFMVLPLSLQFTSQPANAETVDHKPKLFQMMAYNDRIDTNNDELRYDFVLRLAHGDFDPFCVPNGSYDDGSKCRLFFAYQYWGTTSPSDYVSVRYLNTMTTGNVSGTTGALQWAANKDQYFTVHKVINSGDYDYLAISVEADVNFADNLNQLNSVGNSYTSDSGYAPGGITQVERVYAILTKTAGPASLACGWGSWNGVGECGNMPTDQFDENGAAKYGAAINNIMYGVDLLRKPDGSYYTYQLYQQRCADPGNQTTHYCNGPVAFIGWDGYPLLWSQNQANWGLVTDFGFDRASFGWNWNAANSIGFYNDGKTEYAIPPGVAPANSFFVYWYNSANDTAYTTQQPDGTWASWMSMSNCSRNASFYYQWLGLKNNKWVPVDSLTPHAVRVDQNPVTNDSGNEGNFSMASSAFNSITALSGNGGLANRPNRLFLDRSTSPAQGYTLDTAGGKVTVNDGSINFAKAKEDQGLDGYFKLVTWPITTNQPDATKPATDPANSDDSLLQGCMASLNTTYKGSNAAQRIQQAKAAQNPLYDQPDGAKGITDSMSQDQINDVISKGWTIDTAFYRYDVPRPQDPTINSIGGKAIGKDSPVAYSSTLSPVVSGTCTPGNRVTLFGEDPAHPIKDTGTNPDPDNRDTAGVNLGETICGSDGTWSITDANTAYGGQSPAVPPNADGGTRRYHAWQTELSTSYDMTSGFTNIAKAVFQTKPEQAPTVDAVSVPHTKRDESIGTTALPQGSQVKVSGTVSPAYLKNPSDSLSRDSTLTVTMTPSGGVGFNRESTLAVSAQGTFTTGGARSSSPAVMSGSTLTVTRPSASQPWKWSLTMEPSVFLANMDGSESSQTYQFQAFLTNQAGTASPRGAQTFLVDMTPTETTITKANSHQVSGKAYIAGHGNIPERDASLKVTWPDGSTDTATTDASGSWNVRAPAGLSSGDVSVTLTDTAGNESGRFERHIGLVPPVQRLPFTGGGPRLILLIVAAIILALTACLAIWVRQRRGFGRLVS